MIQINLLPQETSGGRSAGAPALSGASSGALAVAAILIPVYIVLLVAGFFIWNSHRSEQQTLAELEERQEDLNARISSMEAEYEDLTNAMLNVENQLALLRILDPEDRLYWAKKLNILPALVPDGIHLTNINVSETVREIETEESKRMQAEYNKLPAADRPAEAPPKLTRPVITQTLELQGLAYVSDGTSDERLQLIVDFHNNLRNGTAEVPFSGDQVSFLEGFRPVIPFTNVRGATVDGRDVTTFNFEMTTIPVAVETSEERREGAGA